MLSFPAISTGLAALQLFAVGFAAPWILPNQELTSSITNIASDPLFNATNSRRFPIPFTSPPITLVFREQGAALNLRKAPTTFQTLVEAVARLSDHNQEQQLPPDPFTLAYEDCIVGVANPASVEEMSYAAAVSSLRGLGEFLLENDEWTNAQEVRISIEENIVGTMLIKKNEFLRPGVETS